MTEQENTPRRSGRGRIAAIGGALLVGALLAGHFWLGAPTDAAPRANTAAPGLPVSIARAQPRDVPVLNTNIGTVQAYQSVLVRARVEGTLDSINFVEGQMVQAGDLLAQIDPRPYQATLDSALAKEASDQAGLTNNKKNLGRDAALLASSFATKQAYDNDTSAVAQTEAAVAGDKAAINAAQLNLDFTHITAPIGGRVGLRLVDAGNLIQSGDTTGIVTIDQIQPITVMFSLPQDDLPAVQTAMAQGKPTVQAYTDDDRTMLDTGQLLTIDDGIDTSTGTFKLKAVFPNVHGKLWPGQEVSARLQVATLNNAVTIPSAAINRGPNGLYVFTVTPDNTVKMQPVTVQQDDGQVAVVASGLTAGATVVTNGQSKLQDGTKVTAHSAPANS